MVMLSPTWRKMAGSGPEADLRPRGCSLSEIFFSMKPEACDHVMIDEEVPLSPPTAPGIHQVAWCYQNASGPQHMVSITGIGSMTQESCPALTGGLSLTMNYVLIPSYLHGPRILRKK